MNIFAKKANSPIIFQIVTIGNKEMHLPVAQFSLGKAGPRVIITAGLDGDEYAGIEAAFQLINTYASTPPPFSVTILPIVNIPGFQQQVSYNPQDGLYPKHFFPGKKDGKPTEQLLSWLATNFLFNSSLWIDLHSGSLQESLTPFVWTYQTKHKTVDGLITYLLSSLSPSQMIYHQSPPQKIRRLAEKGIGYLMLEAGEKGERNTTSINQFVKWVEQSIAVLNDTKSTPKLFPAYSSIDEYYATKDGLWYPSVTKGTIVTKGTVLGTIYSLDQKKLATLTAKKAGVVLWEKISLPVKKHDLLFGVGVKKKEFKENI